ncbi:MAG: TetR/AcrR family transcriptional regulator [Acidimicrobiales bacterium]
MPTASPAIVVPTGRKARRTHRALVEATRAVVNQTGGFNADLVAERAGVAPATFYVYFPSKDDALAAALDDALGELVERTMAELSIERILDGGLRPSVAAAIEAALGVFRSSAVVLRLALARIPDSRTVRQVYRDHQRQATRDIRQVILRASAAGQIVADDPETLTMALLVVFQGLNNPLLLGRQPDSRVVAHLVDMVVRLLDPPPNDLERHRAPEGAARRPPAARSRLR